MVASTCSRHLATYLLGWLLASVGIGVLIISSDLTLTNGNLTLFLLVGFLILGLGGALILISVVMPDRCNGRPDILKRHEGTYIRFSPSTNGHHSQHYHHSKLSLPRDELVTSSQLLNNQNDFNGSCCDSNLLSVPWPGIQVYPAARTYSEENRLSFYRETPV